VATVPMSRETHDEAVRQGIVVIDFWAAWCSPCLRFAPVLERVSDDNRDVTFARVDTDADPELAEAYGACAVPTLVILRDGVPVFGQAGAMPQDVLEDLVRQVRGLDMAGVRATYAAQLLVGGLATRVRPRRWLGRPWRRRCDRPADGRVEFVGTRA
jgi:thioredoxin 1